MVTNNIPAYQYSVTVPWPYERTIQDEHGNEVRTCDPNDLMRPDLHRSVGVQGIDWDWDISRNVDNALDVYFNDGTEAVKFKLVWS
jgi:hypothetical protein